MWHKNNKVVFALILAICTEAYACKQICPHVSSDAHDSMRIAILGPAGVGAVDPHTFRRDMGDAYKRNWAGLHVSPRTAPSACTKSCTYLRWFARPGKMPAEPYFELPISLSKLRRLVQFRLGSHDLPIEQGRMARPIVPRYLRRCTLCSRRALVDESHFMLECSQFDGVHAQYADLLQDARDSMRNLMWHQNQKALSDFVFAILDEPRT